MPGGKSYKAALVRDAGGDYLWKNDTTSGSLPLDFEAVYVRALGADVWLETSEQDSFAVLTASDSRYKQLKALQGKNVYNNNRRMNTTGGNDFFERGALHADEVLADYIRIFHPELLPEHELIYHKKLD